jgi:hypothetical protein
VTPADLRIQLEWRMELLASHATMTDAALAEARGARYEFPYVGRIQRHGVLAAYALRIAPPEPTTAILWVDDDARVAFIAAADAHEAFVKGSAQEVPGGEAVPRLADALAWWAYLDTVPRSDR